MTATDEPVSWRSGERILVTLPDGHGARCRVMNVLDDGTVHAVPSMR
jgi:hypothetical protein